MAKKHKSKHVARSSGGLHRRLEQPVHNLVGYGVLLALSAITLFIVLKLQG